MNRKIYNYLLNWKISNDRKPLILQGARQVGKTFIASTFGDNEYSNVVICNFEQEPDLKEFFKKLEPKTIIENVSAYKRKEIIPGHTLIIFDEVQACPEALTSLKYFNEQANEYHIIATGSLLGIAVNRQETSFPVGKVETVTMYPMDFEEFFLACNEKNSTIIENIKKCYKDNTPIPQPFHDMALDAYKRYLYVGGLPEVVDIYIKTNNYEMVRIKQNEILNDYLNDMSKYNRASEIPKTRLIFKSISTQLAKENKKFKYSSIKRGGRSKDFEQSLEWLSLVGVANQLFRLEQIKLPLLANKSNNDFKFYMNDVGLCAANQKIIIDDILYSNPSFDDFKGGLTENYVYNQLLINGFDLYYWTSKSDAEIDFISRIGVDIIPIEVKSSDNTRSKSLNVYMKEMKPKYAIRISSKNFGFENNIKSVPLYAVFCIEANKN